MTNPIQVLTKWYRTRLERGRPYITLLPERMANTRLLPTREALIEALPKGGIIAEVGVDMGDFSQKILTISNPTHFHLVDLWPPSVVRNDRYSAVANRFQKEIDQGLVSLHRGDSEETMAGFADHTFDWIYLDTTHLYDKTVRELAICAKKVKPGGWLCGHDYTLGSWKDGVRYGVIEAVNDFCNTHGWDLVYLTNEPHRYISYALQKKNR